MGLGLGLVRFMGLEFMHGVRVMHMSTIFDFDKCIRDNMHNNEARSYVGTV